MNILNKYKMNLDFILFVVAIVLLLYLGINRVLRHSATLREEEIPLKIYPLVREVKEQLTKLNQTMNDSNEAALFAVKNFDLELNFVIRKSTQNEVGFESDIVTIKKGNDINNEQVQKIFIHMEVIPPSKGSVKADTTVEPF
jgi:hypothetical protein